MPVAEDSLEPEYVRRRDQRRRQFGESLRQTRFRVGISQEELSHRSGVSRTMIVRIEAGQRSLLLDRVFDLADGLGVSATALLGAMDKAETDGR